MICLIAQNYYILYCLQMTLIYFYQIIILTTLLKSLITNLYTYVTGLEQTNCHSIFLKPILLFLVINAMFIEITLYLYLSMAGIYFRYLTANFFVGILIDESLKWSYHINYVNTTNF